MNKEELKRRTKEFAHRCVKLAMSLPETGLGRHIRRQLIIDVAHRLPLIIERLVWHNQEQASYLN